MPAFTTTGNYESGQGWLKNSLESEHSNLFQVAESGAFKSNHIKIVQSGGGSHDVPFALQSSDLGHGFTASIVNSDNAQYGAIEITSDAVDFVFEQVEKDVFTFDTDKMLLKRHLDAMKAALDEYEEQFESLEVVRAGVEWFVNASVDIVLSEIYNTYSIRKPLHVTSRDTRIAIIGNVKKAMEDLGFETLPDVPKEDATDKEVELTYKATLSWLISQHVATSIEYETLLNEYRTALQVYNTSLEQYEEFIKEAPAPDTGADYSLALSTNEEGEAVFGGVVDNSIYRFGDLNIYGKEIQLTLTVVDPTPNNNNTDYADADIVLNIRVAKSWDREAEAVGEYIESLAGLDATAAFAKIIKG